MKVGFQEHGRISLITREIIMPFSPEIRQQVALSVGIGLRFIRRLRVSKKQYQLIRVPGDEMVHYLNKDRQKLFTAVWLSVTCNKSHACTLHFAVFSVIPRPEVFSAPAYIFIQFAPIERPIHIHF
jgi:hypothetical protein